jgi:hypothetical protein
MMQDTWANSYLLFSVLGGALIVLKGLTDMVHNDK